MMMGFRAVLVCCVWRQMGDNSRERKGKKEGKWQRDGT